MKSEAPRMGLAELLPLLDTLDEGVVLHAEDGGVLACNTAFRQMVQLGPTDLPGPEALLKSLAAFEEDDTPVRPENEPVDQLLQHGSPDPAREIGVPMPDGSTVWLACRAALLPQRSPGGGPWAVTLFTDRSEQHSLRREVISAHSMATLGRLSGQLAHDIRNLLTVILGNNEVLLEDLQPSGPGWRESMEIRGAAELGRRFIGQLLTLSAGGPPVAERFSLNELLTDMEPMLARLLGGGIVIRMKLVPKLAPVIANRTGIEQVVLNLALNARDAMGTSGRLTISVANAEISPELAFAVPGLKQGRYVALKVQDDGPGMDEATRSRAFEPFFTTRGGDRGFGLGLSIVRNVVERNGGHVDLATEPGLGTTLSVYLPCADPAIAERAESHVAQSKAG